MKTGFEKAKGTFWQCGSLLLAALLFPSAIARGQTQPPAKPEPAPIRPFKMHVPDRVLIDLRRRLAEANWPDQLPGTTWEYGADIKTVRELADYWQNGYDWRAQEAKINQFDQFTTEIDGQQIYFIHQRSPRPNAIGLIAAFALGRVITSMIYGVSSRDLTTFLLVTTLLVVVSFFASLIPTLRATRVDPLAVLRDE